MCNVRCELGSISMVFAAQGKFAVDGAHAGSVHLAKQVVLALVGVRLFLLVFRPL